MTWPGHGEKTGWADGDRTMEGGPPVSPPGQWGAQRLSCLSMVRGLLRKKDSSASHIGGAWDVEIRTRKPAGEDHYS